MALIVRCLALFFLLLAPLSAQSAGLGRLTVISAIGEPFNAQIELIGAGKAAPSLLTARLASPETYQQFNLRYGAARANLRVTVEVPPTGQPYIKVASTEYVYEPVLPLLIELEWVAGRLTRKYMALLDLPKFDFSAPLPSVAPAARDLERPSAPTAASVAPAAPAAPAPAPSEKVRVVTRISKSAPLPDRAGMQENLDERARILEEEAIAGNKKLTEVKERIAHLEKTIKDMQVLVERKDRDAVGKPGMATPASAQEQAIAKQEGATAVGAAEVMPQPRAANVDKAPPAGLPEPVADKPEPAIAMEPVAKPPAAKAKPRPPVMAPAPEPEPAMIEILMDYLPLVGGGVAVLLGMGLLLARRRRTVAAGDATGQSVSDVEPAERDRAASQPAAEGDGINAIEEAQVFLAHGREAQAVQVLEEALAENPLNEDARLKLLEVHAARKDKAAFGAHARTLHELTGGEGANWLRAAALGFALDPTDALYEAGRGARSPDWESESQALDFDAPVEPSPAPVAQEPAQDDTIVERNLSRGVTPEAGTDSRVDFELASPSEPEPLTDISFDVPDSGTPTTTDFPLDAGPASGDVEGFPAIDFDIESSRPDEAPIRKPGGATAEQRDASRAQEAALDLSGINLDLDDGQKSDAPPPGGKDPHWQDVQEKFELVKAYQLLGAERESMEEILQEILKEGDAQQRAEAKKLIDGLSEGGK